MNKQISGHTTLIALLGSPVSHSISPLMHNEAFRLLGLDYVYLCFDVTENTLKDAVTGLKTFGARGFNLTMPNKNKIIDYLDELTPAASMIGAVNTVLCENDKLIGYNTDGIGFLHSVSDAGFAVKGKTITVMGSGGAATAICAQAALDGVAVLHIFARPSSRFWLRMQTLTDTINHTTQCRAFLHETQDTVQLQSCLLESYLLVNATSVGMAPHTEDSVIQDASLLPKNLVVSDIIYNPRETKLLHMARERGCSVFNGMYMLLYQGAAAFQIWTGEKMPVEDIKKKYFSPA